MISGLAAPVVNGLGTVFRKDGRISAHRIVLAATLAAVGWALWAGWAQWVVLGEGIASGGFCAAAAAGLARWAAIGWVAGVLLWPLLDDKDTIAGVVGFLFFVCLIGTGAQAAVVHGVLDAPERTHYRAVVSCAHCGKSCYVSVKLGESWTDWEHVECCRCGIRSLPENVPEYAENRKAWDARIAATDGKGGAR